MDPLDPPAVPFDVPTNPRKGYNADPVHAIFRRRTGWPRQIRDTVVYFRIRPANRVPTGTAAR